MLLFLVFLLANVAKLFPVALLLVLDLFLVRLVLLLLLPPRLYLPHLPLDGLLFLFPLPPVGHVHGKHAAEPSVVVAK